jgi:hypothetical protein
MRIPAHAEKIGCFGALILSKVVKIVFKLAESCGQTCNEFGIMTVTVFGKGAAVKLRERGIAQAIPGAKIRRSA